MKPNDQPLRRKTHEELLQSFLTLLEPDPPSPPPKPAAQRAQERWGAQKPIEAVIRDEAAHNETLIERLRAEREAKDAEDRRGHYQGLIDRIWQNQLDCQADLAQLGRPSFHRGPGDPDW